MSVDPLVGENVNENGYCYVGNSPMVYNDPTGLEKQEGKSKGDDNTTKVSGTNNKNEKKEKSEAALKSKFGIAEDGSVLSTGKTRWTSHKENKMHKQAGAQKSSATGWVFKDNYTENIKPKNLPQHPKETVIVETMKIQLLELPTSNTGNVEIQKVAPVQLPIPNKMQAIAKSEVKQVPKEITSQTSRTGSDLGPMTEGYQLQNIKTFYNKVIAIMKDNPTATVNLTVNVYGGGRSEQQLSQNRFYNDSEGKSSNELESVRNVFSQTRNYFNNAQVGSRINYNFVITNNPQLSTGRAVFNK